MNVRNAWFINILSGAWKLPAKSKNIPGLEIVSLQSATGHDAVVAWVVAKKQALSSSSGEECMSTPGLMRGERMRTPPGLIATSDCSREDLW